MYVIEMPDGTFVLKGDGTNDFVRKPMHASQFCTKEQAAAAKPGHHADMGGTGFKGTVRTYSSVEWKNDH